MYPRADCPMAIDEGGMRLSLTCLRNLIAVSVSISMCLCGLLLFSSTTDKLLDTNPITDRYVLGPCEPGRSWEPPYVQERRDNGLVRSTPRWYKTSKYRSITDIPRAPIMVVIVTYQRTGSSFLAEILHQNPSAFMWFEPMDGVYSALYGTEYGNNVPADIWNEPDGSPRKLPSHEIDVMAQVAKNLLTCNLRQLPTEMLMHPFITTFNKGIKPFEDYGQCIKNGTKDSRKMTVCKSVNRLLAKSCGRRFGQIANHQKECAQYLTPRLLQNLTLNNVPFDNGEKPQIIPSTLQSRFLRFTSLMKSCTTTAHICLPRLESHCKSASIRSFKTVRMSMEAVKRLQEILPDIKVIYNLRDPRAVVNSRHNTSSSFQAIYAGGMMPENKYHDVVKEARLFCRSASSDLTMFRRLQSAKPQSMLQVIYENYASKPVETARRIYDFLNKAMPTEVLTWLTEHTRTQNLTTQTTRDSNLTSIRWQDSLSQTEQAHILNACEDLFSIRLNAKRLWEPKICQNSKSWRAVTGTPS